MSWLQTQKRAGRCCRYCGSPRKLTKDHIRPLSRGGKNTKWNYQPLCQYCNSKKGNLMEYELACIFRDIKKRGVCYKWENKYANWLDYIEIKRKEYKRPPLNW